MSMQSNRALLNHPMGKWGLFMAFLFLLWFGGWYALASYADGLVGKAISDIDDRGIRVECNNRDIKGFPFRIGVTCDKVNIAHKRDVFRIELGALRTAAQLYAPGEMVAEIDGPFRSWPAGTEVTANWSALRLFLDANFSGGFDLASLSFADFLASAKDVNFSASKGAVHFRPTPVKKSETVKNVGSLDGAVNLFAAKLARPRGSIPPIDLEADATLIDGYHDLINNRRPLRSVIRDGAQIEIRNLALVTPGGGRLAIAGPLEWGVDGMLSGKIRIGILQPESIVTWVDQIDPNLTDPIKLLGQAIASSGKSENIGGTSIRTVTVTIEQGQPRLGFLPLPIQIPPLFQN